MIQFYAPDIADTLTLPESDSQHAVRVLRLREGDELTVVDGKGRRYRCVITRVRISATPPWRFSHPRRCSLRGRAR